MTKLIEKLVMKLLLSNSVGVWLRGVLYALAGYMSANLEVPENLSEQWAALSVELVKVALPALVALGSSFANKKLQAHFD
jgi:hypothetical protein